MLNGSETRPLLVDVGLKFERQEMPLIRWMCGSKRHSIQAVELSRRLQTAVQIVSKSLAPSNGHPIYRFWAGWPCRPAGWLALLIKAGDAETNPGPTTTHKQVWFATPAINKYKVGSRYRKGATGLNIVCT